MARIPYYNPETSDEDTNNLIKNLPPLNIFRMLMHAPDAGKDFIRLGGSILLNGRLDPVLREIAIIRTGILCGSGYEVHQHLAIGRRLGMSEVVLAALKEGSASPVFSEQEKLVLRLAEEIVTRVKAADETFFALLKFIGHEKMAELVIAIGYYRMVSSFLETFEVDIEPSGEDGARQPG